jgi:hypothetical protein
MDVQNMEQKMKRTHPNISWDDLVRPAFTRTERLGTVVVYRRNRDQTCLTDAEQWARHFDAHNSAAGDQLARTRGAPQVETSPFF